MEGKAKEPKRKISSSRRAATYLAVVRHSARILPAQRREPGNAIPLAVQARDCSERFGRETWSGSRAPRVGADPPWRNPNSCQGCQTELRCKQGTPKAGCVCCGCHCISLSKVRAALQPMAGGCLHRLGSESIQRDAAVKF